MITETVTVRNKTGIHARPASVLAKLTRKYQAIIELNYNDKTVRMKSLMGLLTAGIKYGVEVEISCDGEDEQAAMAEITKLFNSGFGEI